MKLFCGLSKLFKFSKHSKTSATTQAVAKGQATVKAASSSAQTIVAAPVKDTVQIAAKSSSAKLPVAITPDQMSMQVGGSVPSIPERVVAKMRRPLPPTPPTKGVSTPVSSQHTSVSKTVVGGDDPAFSALMKSSDDAIVQGKSVSQRLQAQTSAMQKKLQPEINAQIKQQEKISDLLSRPLDSSSRAPSRVRPTSSSKSAEVRLAKQKLLDTRKQAHQAHMETSTKLNQEILKAKDPKRLQVLMSARAVSQRRYNAVYHSSNPQEASRIANMKLSEFLQFEKLAK